VSTKRDNLTPTWYKGYSNGRFIHGRHGTNHHIMFSRLRAETQPSKNIHPWQSTIHKIQCSDSQPQWQFFKITQSMDHVRKQTKIIQTNFAMDFCCLPPDFFRHTFLALKK